MTMALCFGCGNIKHGALCPCLTCNSESTGDVELDIMFSDHCMAFSTLKQFGSVIREINRHLTDPNERFWGFIYFVSSRHPEVLHVTLKGEGATRIPPLIDQMPLPAVEVQPGMLHREEAGSPKASEKSPPRRPWWQFWRRE